MFAHSPSPWRRTWRSTLAVALGCFAVVIVVSVRVDGFDVWPSWMHGRLAGHTFGIGRYERMFKPHQLQSRKPRVVFLGTSRTDSTLPATWPGYDDDDVYNAGIKGGHLTAMTQVGTFLLSQDPPDLVVLEVGMISFDDPQENHDSELAVRLQQLAALGPLAPLLRVRESILNPDAMRITATNLKQWASGKPKRKVFERGFHDHRFADDPDPEGWIGRMDGVLSNADLDPRGSGAWPRYLSLVRKLEKAGVELVVFMPPVHAAWHLAASHGPRAAAVEAMKRSLVELHGEVWDFYRVDRHTAQFTYFRDPSHAGGVLGERVHRTLSTGQVLDDFGVKLTADNIDRVLRAQRKAVERYRDDHPELDAAFKKAVRGTDRRGWIPLIPTGDAPPLIDPRKP